MTERTAKEAFRSVFAAMQADCKAFDGGIRAVAEIIGVDERNLAKALNPNDAASPPPFATVLNIVALVQPQRAMCALNRLAGTAPVVVATEHVHESEANRQFHELAAAAASVIGHGSAALRDDKFAAHEKRQMVPILLDLIKEATEMLQVAQGQV